MKVLIEKKELAIKNKIFTKSDLTSFLRSFIGQSEVILEKSKELRRLDLIKAGWSETNITEGYINTSHSGITLTSSDNINYTFSFEGIAEAIKTLDDKIITEVELQFNEKLSECRFSAKLRHSGSNLGSSYVLAEGMDTEWVNETIKKFEDFLETCRNQSMFVTMFRIPIIVATIGLLSFFLINIIEFFIKTEVSFPKIVANIFNDDLLYYIILFVMVSATPAILIYRWLKKLYPAIEIQTGPDSGNSDKQRRRKILMLVLIIVVPVVISVLLK